MEIQNPIEAKAQVEQLVRNMNVAWQESRFDGLYPMFHEQVVAVPPGGAHRVVGREPMIDGFRQFVAHSGVHDFKLLDISVDVFGATAIATLLFQIKYEQKGQVLDEKGTDIMVFAHEGGRWQVVWRTQVPLSEGGA